MAVPIRCTFGIFRKISCNVKLKEVAGFAWWSGERKRHLSSAVAIPAAQYGGRHTVTVLPGDGVGPELLNHVRAAFRCVGAPVDFEEVQLDHTTSDEDYEHALLAIKRNKVAIRGHVHNLIDSPEFKSRNVEIRSELDLFASIVHCKSIPGIVCRHSDVDLVIVRENTEGEYSGLEHQVESESAGGVVESLKIITEKNSTRIAQYAFDYASRLGRKKVTAVHKANIMKLADGMFLECCRNVAKEYPEIEFTDMIVDNCSMQMVSRPHQFDLVVLPNLYGNIITSIGAGLVGGPGVVSGVNLGDRCAIFEPGTRNVGLTIAGKNIANPAGMLLAGADMLDYLRLQHYGTLIRRSVHHVLSQEKIHTPDIGGQNTSSEFMQAFVGNIQEETQEGFT